MHRLVLAGTLTFGISSAAWTCPAVGISLADLVRVSSQVLRVRVADVHDVAGTAVAELEVLEVFKGDVATDTLFLPLDVVFGVDDESPKTGDTALAFMTSDREYHQTREFWRKIDRRRGARPLLVLSISWGWMPYTNEVVSIPSWVMMPGYAASEPAGESDQEQPWREGSMEALTEALTEAVTQSQTERVDAEATPRR